MSISQIEACLNEAGIQLLKDNLSAIPRESDGFLNFGYLLQIEEFSGEFMLHAHTVNADYVYCLLYDSNRQPVYAVGATSNIFSTDTPYKVERIVKYASIYGFSNQQTVSTTSLFLVRNMLKEGGSLPFQQGSFFTDGKKYANKFVRELYISSDIFSTPGSSSHLILLQARNEHHSSSPLITIADRDSFNPSINLYENYFYSNDYRSDVILLRGVGAFAGKKCYIVVDWDTTWSLCEANGMVKNNEILFQANINEYVATHLKFSPTIASYIDPRLPSLGEVCLPTNTFHRETFELDEGAFVEVEAANATDLLGAINNNQKVIINLTDDIQLSSAITISGNKNVIINGHGHAIYEFHNPILSSVVSNGKRCADYNDSFDENTAFTTPDGKILMLSKSEVFQSDGWGGEWSISPYTVRFSADELSSDTDNVFVNFGIWYERRTKQVSTWDNGHLCFQLTGAESSNSFYNSGINVWTKSPYFFLSNYGNEPESVLIKDRKVTFPVSFPSISLCTLPHLIEVSGSSNVKIDNVKFVGGKNHSIKVLNDGNLHLSRCHFSNKIGEGIRSTGKLFVNDCSFLDIRGRGIYATYDTNRINDISYSPYVDVKHNRFQNIGIYGTNVYAVESNVKGFISGNRIIDSNYGAIRIGVITSITDNDKLTWLKNNCENLVEYNSIGYTAEWRVKRKQLGLQDSGAIYIATNNKKAIVRYNNIVGVGGPNHSYGGDNHGIFCDDGAYNMEIYCNIISHTEPYEDKNYDINSRDYHGDRPKPINETFCTNNFINCNICDGLLKMQEHDSTKQGTMEESGCNFNNNVIIQRPFCRKNTKNVINSDIHPYTKGTSVFYDSTGFIDAEGNVFSGYNYYEKFGIIGFYDK